MNTNFERKIVIIFLPIILNMCFRCSFEHPQHMFWLRKNFELKLSLFSFPSIQTCVLDAQKNRLNVLVEK